MKHLNSASKRLATALSAAVLSMGASAAHATLVLTTDGINLGFSLTTFVSGFQNNGVGPLGVALNSQGQVIVNSSYDRRNYVFNDTNNQTVGDALSSTPFNAFPPAYATVNGVAWGSGGFNGAYSGQLVRFNDDGTVAQAYPSISITNGLWTNPVNNHLIGVGNNGILDIDVSGATPTYRVITNSSSDGITVSPDGQLVYTSGGQAYDIATGALQPGSFSVSGADGMGIISSTNALNGSIIVNSTGGFVALVDPTTFVQTIIASGGSRGDYTSPDYTDGSLFLTQSESVLRLSCGTGCAIGSTPPPVTGVPEPATPALMGLGLLAAVLARRRAA